MFEVARGVRGLKRGVTGPFERFDVALHGLGRAYLLNRVIGLDEHQAWFVVAETEDVDHGDDADGRPVFEALDVQPHVAADAQGDQVLDLLPAVLPQAPPVEQRGLGDHHADHRRGAVLAVQDLLPAQPGIDRLAPVGRRPRPGPHQRLGVGGRLQQARQHQWHEHADGGGVVLVAGELTVEDLGILPPPGPGPGPDGQVLDLLGLGPFDAVDPDEVPDVAHLGTLPLVGLEAADLAATPVQDVAGVVGGVAGPDARRGEPAGKPTLGDGGTVGVIAHFRLPFWTGTPLYRGTAML